MTKILILIAIIILLLVLIGVAFYKYQENLIFHPEKLAPDHVFRFSFTDRFTSEELNFSTQDGCVLNALLFNASNTKGLVFYLHGNAGNLQSWGESALQLLENGYDVLMFDYRGYGKSTGTIISGRQLFNDAELVFREALKIAGSGKIIVYGMSLGSGIAARLVFRQRADALILEAPYYSFLDLANTHYPLLPNSLLLKYRFRTNENLKRISCPVYLFHGTDDEVIPYDSSVRLAKAGSHVELITIRGAMHNNVTEFGEYKQKIKEILR